MGDLLFRATEYTSLHDAWMKVRANRGGPGIDNVTLDAYDRHLDSNLASLSAALRNGTYLPAPLREVVIAKRDGGDRRLGIPIIDDRVAQRAFTDAMEPIFEPVFLDCSYGYRPRRGVADAVAAVERARAAKLVWVVDCDISDFFGSVRHDLLLDNLRESVHDEAVMRTLALWLPSIGRSQSAQLHPVINASRRLGVGIEEAVRYGVGLFVPNGADDVYEESPDALSSAKREIARTALRFASASLPRLMRSKIGVATALTVVATGAVAVGARRIVDSYGRGVAQGAPISPLLSNIYLHEFDRVMSLEGYALVRYADDFVICTGSEVRAKNSLTFAKNTLSDLGLSLNAGKTRIVVPDERFRFLGYEFDSFGSSPVPPTSPSDQIRGIARNSRAAIRHLSAMSPRIRSLHNP